MPITQTRTWEQILSTTLDNYMPRLYDNISTHNAFLFELSASGNIVSQPGGTQIVVPLLTGLNTTAKAYTDGDTLDVTYQAGIEAAQYLWKQFAASVTIYGGHMLRNQAPHQAINLITSKIEQAERSLWKILDDSTTGCFSNNGDALTGLSGLQSLISTTPTAGTVGNIPRAANTFWQNQLGTAITSYASNGISRNRTLYYNCVRGNEHPNVIVSDLTSYTNHLTALTGTIRYNLPYGPVSANQRWADSGFANVQFEGAAWTFDSNAPAGNVYHVNTNVLQLIGMEGRMFTNTVWINRSDMDAITARLLFMGELVAKDMGRLGVITGANIA